MGYYSEYSLDLDLKDTAYKREDLIAELRGKSEYAAAALLPNGETASEDKWYDFDEDMLALSKKYADVVFALERRGQHASDIEKRFYKNGGCKVQEASLSSERFDENKLILDDPQPVIIEDMVGITGNKSLDTEYLVTVVAAGEPTFYDPDLGESLLESLPSLSAETKQAFMYMDDGIWFFRGHEWINHEADLMKLSQAHPEITIRIQDEMLFRREDYNISALEGLVNKFFKNGKIQRASKAEFVFDKPYFGFVSSKTSN